VESRQKTAQGEVKLRVHLRGVVAYLRKANKQEALVAPPLVAAGQKMQPFNTWSGHQNGPGKPENGGNQNAYQQSKNP